MKYIRLVSLVSASALALLLSLAGTATSSKSEDEVLRQETRWLTAIVNGDRKTIESILSKNFKHINSKGKLLNRDQEVANTVKEPFTMNPSDQLVDFAGDTALIHGVNTVTQAGKVLARERFTDVFVKQNGTWIALSAQETAI